jgi:hypothetical protein
MLEKHASNSISNYEPKTYYYSNLLKISTIVFISYMTDVQQNILEEQKRKVFEESQRIVKENLNEF